MADNTENNEIFGEDNTQRDNGFDQSRSFGDEENNDSSSENSQSAPQSQHVESESGSSLVNDAVSNASNMSRDDNDDDIERSSIENIISDIEDDMRKDVDDVQKRLEDDIADAENQDNLDSVFADDDSDVDESLFESEEAEEGAQGDPDSNDDQTTFNDPKVASEESSKEKESGSTSTKVDPNPSDARKGDTTNNNAPNNEDAPSPADEPGQEDLGSDRNQEGRSPRRNNSEDANRPQNDNKQKASGEEENKASENSDDNPSRNDDRNDDKQVDNDDDRGRRDTNDESSPQGVRSSQKDRLRKKAAQGKDGDNNKQKNKGKAKDPNSPFALAQNASRQKDAASSTGNAANNAEESKEVINNPFKLASDAKGSQRKLGAAAAVAGATSSRGEEKRAGRKGQSTSDPKMKGRERGDENQAEFFGEGVISRRRRASLQIDAKDEGESDDLIASGAGEDEDDEPTGIKAKNPRGSIADVGKKSKKKAAFIIAAIMALSLIVPIALVFAMSSVLPSVSSSVQDEQPICDPEDPDGNNSGSGALGDLGDVGDATMPAEGIYTSSWGERDLGYHKGMDIANEMGTPIYAAHDGTVISSGPATGYGLWVRIQSDKEPSIISIYGHQNRNHVKEGDKVKAGQHIADMASEGFSTGPHLHFQIEKNGQAIPAENWLKSQGITVPPLQSRISFSDPGSNNKGRSVTSRRDNKEDSDNRDSEDRDNRSPENSENGEDSENGENTEDNEEDSGAHIDDSQLDTGNNSDDDDEKVSVGCVCSAEGKSGASHGGSPGASNTGGDVESRQKKYVPIVIAAGEELGMSEEAIITALMTVQVESTAWRNYANDGSNLGQSGALVDENTSEIGRSVEMDNDGIATDAASVGLFQQQVSKTWGTVDDLMKVPYQAGRFYTQLHNVGLADAKDNLGANAQRVQGSAFPDRYQTQESAARELYAKYKNDASLSSEDKDLVNKAWDDYANGNRGGGGSSSSGGSKKPSGFGKCATRSGTSSGDSEMDGYIDSSKSGDIAKKAAKIALQQIGKPYVWGANGPDSFDCSGLIDYAYKQAGLQSIKNSGERFTTKNIPNYGKPVKKENITVGDAIITNNSNHVMMYIGNGMIVEAQQSGVPVLKRPLDEITGIVGIYRFVDENDNELK